MLPINTRGKVLATPAAYFAGKVDVAHTFALVLYELGNPEKVVYARKTGGWQHAHYTEV